MSNQFFSIDIEIPVDSKCSEMNLSLTKAVRKKGLIISVRGAGLFEPSAFASIELNKSEARRLVGALNEFINDEITATGCEKSKL